MRPPQREHRTLRAETIRTAGASETQPAAGTNPQDGALDAAAGLLREKEQLEQAMRSRPVIDMARGVLMARFACRPDEAWEILVSVSQHANVMVRPVAEAVTAATTGVPLPPSLGEYLAEAVRAWRERV